MTDPTRPPKPGDEFTDDHGETRVVARVEDHDEDLVIFDADGDAVIVAKARFQESA